MTPRRDPFRPTPRLFEAVRRLGIPGASAGHYLNRARWGEGDERAAAREFIRVAIHLRHTPLPHHRHDPRPPVKRRSTVAPQKELHL